MYAILNNRKCLYTQRRVTNSSEPISRRKQEKPLAREEGNCRNDASFIFESKGGSDITETNVMWEGEGSLYQ
jgi:hypothetical protein